VLELLVDEDGASPVLAACAARPPDVPDHRRVGRVAAGGCAFLEPCVGTNVNTGDSYLLGAEVGAELSGMEFSNSYSLAPAATSVTKSAYYFFDLLREDGSVLEGAGSRSAPLR